MTKQEAAEQLKAATTEKETAAQTLQEARIRYDRAWQFFNQALAANAQFAPK